LKSEELYNGDEEEWSTAAPMNCHYWIDAKSGNQMMQTQGSL